MTQTMEQAQLADRSTERTMVHDRRSIYVVCEDMDFVWSMRDVRVFDRAWKRGQSITDIAELLGREVDEVAVLAIDSARNGRIGARRNGVFQRRSSMLLDRITGNHGTPVPRSKKDTYVPPPTLTYTLPPDELERYRAMKPPKREKFMNIDVTYRK